MPLPFWLFVKQGLMYTALLHIMILGCKNPRISTLFHINFEIFSVKLKDKAPITNPISTVKAIMS